MRSARPLESVADRCQAFASRMSPGHAFSHDTAAALWGMPLPSYVDASRIHVSAPAPSRAPSGKWVLGHSVALDVGDIVTRGQLRVTSPALTWLQLFTSLSLHDLVAAGDFALTGNPYLGILPIVTRAELDEVHDRRGASRGRRARDVALPALREGALSRPESLVRYFLERAGIVVPEVNPTILDERGTFLAMPDLAWPEFRFAVEYEGDHHRAQAQFRRDIRRIERLIDAGWSVMKVSADDLFDRPDELVQRVSRRLTGRGWVRPRVELRHIARIPR